jgi:hypothetical protein
MKSFMVKLVKNIQNTVKVGKQLYKLLFTILALINYSEVEYKVWQENKLESE